MSVQQFIANAGQRVQQVVAQCKTNPHVVISRYTAAIAGNFQLWLAMTKPRDDDAFCKVYSNFVCETLEDHRGMLLAFEKSCQSDGSAVARAHTGEEVETIFKLFTDKVNRGLSGVALGAVLENTSKIFIPNLASLAKECGCKDFTYTDKHGEADIKHSDEFFVALELELMMGYDDPNLIIKQAGDAALALIDKIYA